MKNRIRVLMIMPGLNYCGGIETVIMNYYSEFNLDNYQIDFLTHDISENSYLEFIKKRGSNVYLLPKFSFNTVNEIKTRYIQILDDNHYDIVHCNMANAAFLYLRIAKNKGINVRILHSHQNKAADKKSHAVRNIPLLFFGKKYANKYMACSKIAGDFLFGKKKYYILPNSIEYSDYYFNQKKREEIRSSLGLEGKLVLGHTGRLCPQKNQIMLLQLVNKLKEKYNNILLLLVGDGDDKEILQTYINNHDLNENVILYGSSNQVSLLLQAMDIFLFPSIYEGFGMSALESQISGLPTICSNNVPKEIKIMDYIYFLPVENNLDEWVTKIESICSSDLLKNRNLLKVDKTYDINKNSKMLDTYYKAFLSEEK